VKGEKVAFFIKSERKKEERKKGKHTLSPFGVCASDLRFGAWCKSCM